MPYVYLALNWTFGILTLILGVTMLLDAPLAGLAMFGIALLLLPPARAFVYSKINTGLSPATRGVLILILFISFGFFAGEHSREEANNREAQQEKELAEIASKREQKNIDHFMANRDQIIAAAKETFTNKDYKAVVAQTTKYIGSGDDDLKQIHSQASKLLAEKQKAEKTDKLLSELKTVPAREYAKNRDLYKQLVDLHPVNNDYKNKVAFYTEKEKEAEAKRTMIQSQFSPWDGSHRNLERMVKKVMHDPDSYDHDETTYWDRGDHLVVKMTYRGKNAFGGIVRNFIKAKVSLDGQVLQILDES